MAERLKGTRKVSRVKMVLANGQVAERGNIACLNDSGALVAASDAAGLLPIGYFEQSFTGDGTQTTFVLLFDEIAVHRFGTVGGGTAVTASNIGQICYLENGSQVSTDDTNSVAGRVWQVDDDGIWVQMALSLGPQGPEGPEGPPGE